MTALTYAIAEQAQFEAQIADIEAQGLTQRQTYDLYRELNERLLYRVNVAAVGVAPPVVAGTTPQFELINLSLGNPTANIPAGGYFTFSLIATSGSIDVTVGGVTQTIVAGTAVSSFTISHPQGTLFQTPITVQVQGDAEGYATREFLA